MKSRLYLVLLITIQLTAEIRSECSGGIWPIQDAVIGSFAVAWRYNLVANTVQFIIQGQASASLNLTSTYISIGWSDTASATDRMDVAMYFPGTRLVQDRYSRGHSIPLFDTQQDFCVSQTNITDRNISVVFERFITTGDAEDISFTSTISLIFSIGSYTLSNDRNTFHPQTDFYRQVLNSNISLVHCASNGCSTTNCTTPSCPCLQGMVSNVGQCTCFPSSCVTIPRLATNSLPISAIMNGSCQNQTNPCSVNGICLQTSAQQFICQCKTDYTGVLCQTSLFSSDISTLNACQCVNGGVCLNNGTCSCSDRYRGKFCQLTNPCTDYCSHSGVCKVTCTDTACGSPRCTCSNGYIGARCNMIDSCLSNPCNQGTCITSSNCLGQVCGYLCLCSNGTNGTNCEQENTPCCLNGGTCLRHKLTNMSSCECPSNTTGTRCETIQTICTNVTCSNHGVCYVNTSLDDGSEHCLCSAGFTGQYCQTPIISVNPCARNPCGYNGTCIGTAYASSYHCICSNGLMSQSCDSNIITSCASSPCHYLSTCQPIENTNPVHYKCLCPDYLTGDRCQYANACQKQPCLNQGTCIPFGPQNNFMCRCPPGFGHYDCSIYMGLSCNLNVCLNGGICDSNGTNIRCLCPNNFAGPRCEWTSVCSMNTCENSGTCRQIAPTMAECLCSTGYTGPICSLRDTCTTSPCKNGGGCTALLGDTGTSWSAYRCICPPGIYGQTCDATIGSCANMPCPTYKICSERAAGPVCTCSGNRLGTFCQYDNPCNRSSSHCQNAGTCVSSNTDPPKRSCLCREGFTGLSCESPINHNPCASNPCQTRGHCVLSTSNKTFACVCEENFLGEQCERSNPCASSPCLNQAVCQANWNLTDTWFTCRCVGTYTGKRCETPLLNPCAGLCMNGSPCNNGTCICPAQYTGTFCGFDNPCYNSICKNDGICSVISNTTSVSSTCTCSSLYTGQYCEIPLNVSINGSCATECMNGGSCSHGMCMCTSPYIGPACQYDNPCVNGNPCLNSGTCFGRYDTNGTLSTQCFCSQGYMGSYCEATLCSPSSCNGGLCTATQNSIVCRCSTGKFGDRCQYADACATNPCSTNERCEQLGSQYQCVSCYDKSSYCSIYQLRNEYCDDRYTILVDNNFLPVPEACQRSCGQCIPVQHLKEISLLFSNSTFIEDNNVTSSPTIQTKIRQTKCVDQRDDCSMQKAYGFCHIFNEKYPEDCVKTCHPDCSGLS